MNRIIEKLNENSKIDEFGNRIIVVGDKTIRFLIQDERAWFSVKDLLAATSKSMRRANKDSFPGDGVPVQVRTLHGRSTAKFVDLKAVMMYLQRRSTDETKEVLRFMVDILCVPLNEYRIPDMPTQGGIRYKELPRLPGYCVGEDGSIWSLQSQGWIQVGQRLNKTGYLTVLLTDKNTGDKKVLMSHRAVLLAFSGQAETGHENACHKNGIRTDNRLSNLRWGTHAGNSEDARKHGTLSIGEKNFCAKLDDELVRRIREFYRNGERIKDIADVMAFTGISKATVRSICQSRTWNHVI